MTRQTTSGTSSKSNRKTRALALSVFRALGLSYTTRKQDAHLPSWTGRRFSLYRVATINLMHEVAHWLIADESRRSLPNWGLGSDPDPDAPETDKCHFFLERPDLCVEEEYDASLLGVLLMLWAHFPQEMITDHQKDLFGASFKGPYITWTAPDEHNPHRVADTVARLKRRRLLPHQLPALAHYRGMR